jgi:hypothetical protein
MEEIGAATQASPFGGSTNVDALSMLLVSQTSASILTAQSLATITVSSTTGMFIGGWVALDTDLLQEFVQVLTIPSSTTFTARVRFAHGPTSYPVVVQTARQIVAVGDPANPSQIVKVNADGSLKSACDTTSTTYVGAASSSTLLLPLNLARKVLTFKSVSNGATLYIAKNQAASIGPSGYNYDLGPGERLYIDRGVYTGPWYGIWSNADGSYVNISEDS